jgi:hypothetical protein
MNFLLKFNEIIQDTSKKFSKFIKIKSFDHFNLLDNNKAL